MKFKKPLPHLEKPKGKYFDNQRYKLYAVVIMPDHVHLLIEPLLKDETEFWSIGSILHSIKSYSAKQIPNVMLHIGKVWQDGRYDEMIKNEQEFINKWEYILQNPVKAGLSNTPDEYPFLWDRF
ncbi:MAG: REP-associated tyrosine transposase [Dolichospermum sp.]